MNSKILVCINQHRKLRRIIFTPHQETTSLFNQYSRLTGVNFRGIQITPTQAIELGIHASAFDRVLHLGVSAGNKTYDGIRFKTLADPENDREKLLQAKSYSRWAIRRNT